jgi:hypothetical protein
MPLREILFEVGRIISLLIIRTFLFDLVYHMKETGWEKIEEKDTNDYMYQYREDKTMNF